MRRRRVWVVAVLSCFMLACNLFASPSTPEIEGADATPAALQDATPGTLAPTSTTMATLPPPSVTTTPAGCVIDATFVEDISIPDDTQVAPGQTFRKTWRILNSGTCDWEAGTEFIYASGERMGAPPSVVVPAAARDEVIDVSVDFVAPTTPGTYRSDWQFQAPDGTRFGGKVYVRIVVPGPTETATPTLTPSPTVSPTPTLTPTCMALDPGFQAIVDQADTLGLDVSCAISTPVNTSSALQVYWANVTSPNPHTHYRSLLIWRADTREIYVIQGWDTGAYEASFWKYEDTWVEGLPEVPEACSDFDVPEGYLMPVRGFGKVWCDNSLWMTVGWPDQLESAPALLVQDTDHGLLMKLSGAPIYLVAIDFNQDRATVLIEP